MQGDPTDDAAGNLERGSGSGCAPNTRDVRLLALALEERWPVSAEAKSAAVRRLEAVVSDPDAKPRAFDRAIKALASLSRVNLAAIDTGMRAKAQEELEERVAEIEAKIHQQGDRPS